MRCPKCGKLQVKAAKGNPSIKCVFCGAVFRPSEAPLPMVQPPLNSSFQEKLHNN